MNRAGYNGEELKVIILADGEGWYAQGFEIDHDAEGDSLQSVKDRFETSLVDEVARQLKSTGSLDGLLKPTPVEIWHDLWDAGQNFSVTYVSLASRAELRVLPFAGICYFEPLRPLGHLIPFRTTHRDLQDQTA